MDENQHYMAPISAPEEEEIDLLDLCYRVLAQWRVLLIAMLLGLLVVNAFGIFSCWKEVRQAKESADLSETSLATVTGEQEGEITTNAALEGTESVVVPKMKYLHPKYLLLGAVLGLFVAAVYIMFRYIISGTLHVPDEMKNYYGVELLGCVAVQQPKHSAVDTLLLRLFRRERSEEENANEMRMAEAYARVIMNREALKHICITGSFRDEQSAQIISQLQSALAENAESITSGNASPLADVTSLNELVAADGVILVESVERSKAADIRREVELCRANGTVIIGAIILR